MTDGDKPTVSPEFLLEHAGWAQSLARCLVLNRDEAADVVQETWLAALESPPRSREKERPWLRSVIRNLSFRLRRSEVRRVRREIVASRSEYTPSAAELVQRVDLQRKVVEAVLELREPYRETVLLRYFEELNTEEIAKRRNVAVSTVRSRLRRALAQLRARFDREFGGDRDAWRACLVPLLGGVLFEPVRPALPSALSVGFKIGGVLMTAKRSVALLLVLLALILGSWIAIPPLFFPGDDGADSARGIQEPSMSTAASPDEPSLPMYEQRGKASETQRVIAKISGQLRNTEGVPLPEFRVRIEPRDSFGEKTEGGRQLTARTAANGSFTIEGVEPDHPLIMACDLQGLFEQQREILALTEGEHRDLGVIEIEAGLTIRGSVVDPEERPIAGAKIRAYANGVFLPTVHSDDAGRFALPGFSNDTYRVECDAAGYVSTSDVVKVTEELKPVNWKDIPIGDLRFVMEHGLAFDGIVVHRDGSPVVDASIRAGRQRGDGAVWTVASTSTGGDGRFHLEGIPAGPVQIEVMPKEAGWYRFRADSLDAMPEQFEVANSDASLEIIVQMIDGSDPPTSMEYSLDSLAESGAWGRPKWTMQLEEGKGILEDLPEGPYTIQLHPVGLPPTRVVEVALASRETTPVDFLLEPLPPETVIRVQNREGSPIDGARINIEAENLASYSKNSKARTDEAGTYATRVIRGSGVRIFVEAEGYAPFATLDAASLTANGEILVTLVPESTLTAMVLDVSGNPLDRVEVRFNSEDRAQGTLLSRRYRKSDLFGNSVQSSLMTRDGFVHVDQLAPGSYTLQFKKGQENLGELPVTIEEGKDHRVEFRARRSLEIPGTVQINGAPARGGHVKWHSKEDGSTRSAIPVDEDGSFLLNVPSEGRYLFLFAPAGCPEDRLDSQEASVIAGHEVRLEFHTVTFQGLIIHSDGTPAEGVRGFLGREHKAWGSELRFKTDSEGRFTIPFLEPGEFAWCFTSVPADTFAPARKISIHETTSAIFELLDTAPLTVVVGGNPPPEESHFLYVDETGSRTLIRTYLRHQPPKYTIRWPLGIGQGIVEGGDYAPAMFEVDNTPGDTTVEVTRHRGGRLGTRIFDAEGNPLAWHPYRIEPLDETFYPELLRENVTGFSGKQDVSLVPGVYRVMSLLPRGETSEAVATVRAGETTWVDLR